MTERPAFAPAGTLRAVLDAALAHPAGPARTAALAELDRALHGADGLVRALRQARTEDLDERLETGATKAGLADELSVTPTRVDQLVRGNARVYAARTARRQAAAAERRAVRDDVAVARERLRAQVLAEREAERAEKGRTYLERLEAGERLRTIARAEGVPWQRLSALVRAARAARDAEPST